MKNTCIEYLYRDSGNFKTPNKVIIPGIMTREQKDRIMASLITGTYFLQEKVGMPERKDTGDDDGPDWFELTEDGITQTDETENLDVTPDILARRFDKCRDRWFDMPDMNPW